MAAEELAQATRRAMVERRSSVQDKARREEDLTDKMRERLSRAVCLLAILEGPCGVPLCRLLFTLDV
jgi:hypothetical protein